MKPRRHKYGAKPIVVDGVRYASTGEAQWHQQLRWRERAGEIRALRRQVEFVYVGQSGRRLFAYVADAVWEEPDASGAWREVVGDFKGFDTAEGRLKRKLIEDQHGFPVRLFPERTWPPRRRQQVAQLKPKGVRHVAA